MQGANELADPDAMLHRGDSMSGLLSTLEVGGIATGPSTPSPTNGQGAAPTEDPRLAVADVSEPVPNKLYTLPSFQEPTPTSPFASGRGAGSGELPLLAG